MSTLPFCLSLLLPLVLVPRLTTVTARPAAAKKPTAAVKPKAPTLPIATLQSVLASAGRPVSTWETAMVEVVASGKGRIDYENGVARAVGLGALPPPSLARSRAQDTLEARDAALADGLRTLSMAIQQVRVTSDTRVSNYSLKSDEVRLKVAAMVKGAEVVDEKLLPESGIYRVVVQVPLTGAGSIAEAVAPIVPAIAKAEETPVLPRDPYAPGAPAPDNATYTGLIVDCRGLRLNACRAPKLYDGQGSEIYGTVRAAPDFVDEFGIVSYPRSRDGSRRAGDRPLVVRAHGVLDSIRTCPIVSNRDALQIREANSHDHFLERTAVVFIVDP